MNKILSIETDDSKLHAIYFILSKIWAFSFLGIIGRIDDHRKEAYVVTIQCG